MIVESRSCKSTCNYKCRLAVRDSQRLMELIGDLLVLPKVRNCRMTETECNEEIEKVKKEIDLQNFDT